MQAPAIADVCGAVLAGSRRRGRFRCVGTGPDTALAQVARTVECRVFDEEYGNDAREMAQEYAAYEPASYFFVVLDVRLRRPAGVMRVVHARDPRDRLKSVEDLTSCTGFTREDYLAVLGEPDLTSSIDVATLAIPAHYRGSASGSYHVGKLLYRTLNLHATHGGARHVVTILDRRARRSLEYVGAPLTDVLGRAFDYLGSPESYAMCMVVAEMAPSCARRSRELLRHAGSRLVGRRPITGLLRDVALARFTRGLAFGDGTDRHIDIGPATGRGHTRRP